MEVNEIKDKIQRKGLNLWADNNFIGTLEFCTGSGKTRIGILAAEYIVKKNPKAKILILTPSEKIRDSTWLEEFKKWKMLKLYTKNIQTECIQTTYKWKNKKFDLIIADEVHNYIAEDEKFMNENYEYMKFFKRTKYDKLLGLSATIPYNKINNLNKVCPIVNTLTTDKAIELGIVASYVEYNIPVQLTDIEKRTLNKIQRKYSLCEAKLGGSRNAFTNATFILKAVKNKPSIHKTYKEKEQIRDATMFWKCLQERKQYLYNCLSKVKAVNELIEELKIPYSIIFSQTVIGADLISDIREDTLSYHSKLSKKEIDNNLKSFTYKNRKTKHLSTVNKLNEGYDLPKLSNIIIFSRTTSDKTHGQRRGRCLRLHENKIAMIFNLYIPKSQDEVWLRKSQYSTNKKNIIWVKSIKSLKNLLNGNI